MLLFLHTTLIFIVILAIDIGTMIHILLYKHEEPVSAILWMFVVFTFPILGVIFYLFCGINRMKTLGLKIAVANERIHAQQKQQLDAVIERLTTARKQFLYHDLKPAADSMNLKQTLDRLLPNTYALIGNDLELLRDGTFAYPKMLQAIKQARHNIHLQSFIIHNDAVGREILDALEQKARAGVDVKVLYDKFGSTKAAWSHLFKHYLRHKLPNLRIIPFSVANIFAPWRVQLRNHRKLLVVDGKTAFIGGINISSDNDIRIAKKDKYIHDLHCKLKGPAVKPLQLSFLRDWYYASKIKASEVFLPEYFPTLKAQGQSVVRIVDSGPGQRNKAAEKMFLAAAATAKKSLLIMTPYFTPDKSFMTSLTMAAARGVVVRIILPKRNNHWYAQYASRSLYRSLLAHGVRIFEKLGVFSHSKAMLVDGKLACMGSSNCDIRSFRLNYELDFVASEGKFINDLATQFKQELADAEEILLKQIQHKKMPLKLLENLCSLLIPVL